MHRDDAAVLVDLPVPQPDDPTCKRGDVLFMGDDHDCSTFGVQSAEDGHDLVARGGVEVPGRLVGEDQSRGRYQGSGDGGALLLATGHLAREMMAAVLEADLA